MKNIQIQECPLCRAFDAFVNQNQRRAMTGNQSLSNIKWNCKYHIASAPAYRRQIIYNVLKEDIGEMLRQLCEQKKAEIHEADG